MTKAEEILEKHLKINDVETMLGKHGTTHKAVIDALNEAINYTHCCTEFKCGEERVFNEEKCSEQCSQCKEDYSEDI